MKIIITESQYNILNSNLNENYPEHFDMEYFKTLTSFKKRINYCNDNLKRISSGSSRVVYMIDDEKVLKLAKNRKGLAQNEVEVDYSSEYMLEGIVAPVYDSHPDNLWLEMGLATKLTKSLFNKISGYNWEDYINAITKYTYTASGGKQGYDVAMDEELYSNMWEDEFIYEIFQYVGNYDVNPGDLTRLSTYGVINDDIVLIDYGLTHDVYNGYYN